VRKKKKRGKQKIEIRNDPRRSQWMSRYKRFIRR